LRQDDGRADRLEAWHNVTAKIDTKTATADRLTYLAAKDQYDMQGAGAIPARIVDGCAESSGKTVTYFKTENRTYVDGKDVLRVQSKSAGCPPPSPSSR
jgi:lipopolysaccharide export system protein LptA